MTQTTTVSEQDVIAVIETVIELPNIPQETKRNFLAHVQKEGFDEKTLQWMDEVLAQAEAKEQKNIAYLQYQHAQLEQAEAEMEGENSLKAQTSYWAIERMKAVAAGYKGRLKRYNERKNKEEEASQNTEEQSAVEAIKESL